jgi:DNA-binding CsgD family transcriptional regulator
MTSVKFPAPSGQPGCADLLSRLIGYTDGIHELRAPNDVLNELHALTTPSLPLSVLGAARFPSKAGDWASVQLRKSVFLHTSVPKGWWEEYDALSQEKFRPLLFLAATSIAMHTWTEVRRMVQPIGSDTWSYDLALKYGMRDGLTCPVGGRWLVAFWSRNELSTIMTQPLRIMISAAASVAALRLNQLVDPDARIFGQHAQLTPRELAVLRLVSTGARSSEVAKALGLGEETVRSHMKRAQNKLGARNRPQAVAEAVRQHLIP